MPDVMEISSKHRRRMRRLTDAYVAYRKEREHMQRWINELFHLYLVERGR